MKKTITTFILAAMALSNMLNAQNMNCLWAQSAGGSYSDLGKSVSTDANGNVFMAGSFSSPSITLGTKTLTSTGGTDVFIVKYSSSGTVIWANSASRGIGNSVSTDASGNVFMTGHFHSPLIVFGTTTLTSGGSSDIFIVKYSPEGTVLWAKNAGGNLFDQGNSVSTDASGNVFMTGFYDSPSIVFGTTTLTSGGVRNVFLVKYSATGSMLWAKNVGGNVYIAGNSVSTDPEGNVFMTGNFSSPSIVFGTTTLTNGGSSDVFIVKYSSGGTVLWAKNAGGNDIDEGNAISTDSDGNVFMTGRFYSSSITFGTTTLTNAGSANIFIVKYSPSGTVIWASSAVGNYDDCGNGICTDASGNVLITGRFGSSAIAFGTSTLTNPGPLGDFDIFIVKYTPNGIVLWAYSAGGVDWNEGTSVSSDANGNVFVTGRFDSPSIFLGTTILTNTLSNVVKGDIFIAKISDPIVGINDNQKVKAEINIYPNPFSSQTTISFSEEQENINIKIMDVMGKEIKSIPFIQGKAVIIEKEFLKVGIYFIQVIDEKKNLVSKKIVVY